MSPHLPRRLLVSASLVVSLLLPGCGTAPREAETTPGESGKVGLKLAHVFEELGEAPRGRYQSILRVGDRLMLGTEDGVDIYEYSPAEGFRPTGDHYDVRDSAAARSQIYHLRPGPDGVTWAATSEGIARFRGTKFELLEPSGPAKDVGVFRGAVWVARSHGLEIYEPKIPKMSPMPILLRDGSDTSENTGTRKPRAVLAISDTKLLLGTQFGLLLVEKGETSLSWSHYYGTWFMPQGQFVSREAGNAALPGNLVYNLRRSPSGDLIAACTDGGLAVFPPDALEDSSKWTVYQGMHREPKAAPGRGLYHEDVPGNVDMPSSDVSDVVFTETHLFLGTKKGLVRVSRKGPRAEPAEVYGLEDGLPSSQVTGLETSADGKTLFVATQYGLAAYQIR